MKVRTTLPLPVVVVGLLVSALTPVPSRARQGGDGVRHAPPPAVEPFYALVLGNGDYESLPKLETAVKDARAVERVLREYYGFQTRLLVNARRSEIVAALSDYSRGLGADASLLVYYAGHGRKDEAAGKAYWLPADATREDESGWISAEEITSSLRTVPARHVLVVSDSCYSGALPSGLGAAPTRADERERFLQKTAAGRSRTLMASGGDEPSADDGGEGGNHSVFAAALLRGLRGTEGPRFTASELFVGYVLNAVASRTGLIPAYNPLRNSGHEGGDFVFTRIKPPPVPGSCDDTEPKAKLYRKFYDNYRGNVEQQKVAYEAGKEYLARYGSCPRESDKKVARYIGHWVAKYEEALREWERRKSQQP